MSSMNIVAREVAAKIRFLRPRSLRQDDHAAQDPSLGTV